MHCLVLEAPPDNLGQPGRAWTSGVGPLCSSAQEVLLDNLGLQERAWTSVVPQKCFAAVGNYEHYGMRGKE
jgi:hypothetical protein